MWVRKEPKVDGGRPTGTPTMNHLSLSLSLLLEESRQEERLRASCFKAEVCVLDASSYVGFWILKKLLSRGYKVHAALRNDGNERTKTAIREMCESQARKKTLSLFSVDILDYQTILTAMNGCSALFCSLDSSEPYDEQAIETEMRGVLNAVEACARTPSFKKLIFSSSLAASIWNDRNLQVDESCWSDVDYCRKFKLWYPVAKTMSERTAWSLAADRGLDMVSINAALVLGPDVTVHNVASTLSYLKGAEKMQESGVLASVDVDFLANIHISALEDPCANGRYLCYNKVFKSEEESLKLAESLIPLIQIPPRCGHEERVYEQRLRSEKVEKLVEVSMKTK